MYRIYLKYWDTLTPYPYLKLSKNLKKKKSPFYYLLICLKFCWMHVKQCKPWSDAAFCSIWSGFTVFAQTRLSQHLTHCRLNRLSHTIYWKTPISIFGTSDYEIYIFLEKNGQNYCKQWKPWSDAALFGIWSGSALFAKYPFTGLPTTMG